MIFAETLGNGKQHKNTRLSAPKFKKIKKKFNSYFTNLRFFLVFQKRRVGRRMLS